MTNEEAINELKYQVYKNTDNCEMKILKDCYKATINSLEENAKLKAEIERINTQIAESKAEGVGILCNILELREENKWLEEQLEKLEKYNSELCMELTITMDKLCLAEKEIKKMKGE